MSLFVFIGFCLVLVFFDLLKLSDFGLIGIGLGFGALLALFIKERKQ